MIMLLFADWLRAMLRRIGLFRRDLELLNAFADYLIVIVTTARVLSSGGK